MIRLIFQYHAFNSRSNSHTRVAAMITAMMWFSSIRPPVVDRKLRILFLLTKQKMRRTLPLSNNSVGGKYPAPLERRFHFMTPVSPRFVGVVVSYGTIGRTGVFMFRPKPIGGIMPNKTSSPHATPAFRLARCSDELDRVVSLLRLFTFVCYDPDIQSSVASGVQHFIFHVVESIESAEKKLDSVRRELITLSGGKP